MLTALIDWSLHNRLVMLAGALCFVVLGALSLGRVSWLLAAPPAAAGQQAGLRTATSAGIFSRQEQSEAASQRTRSSGNRTWKSRRSVSSRIGASLQPG